MAFKVRNFGLVKDGIKRRAAEISDAVEQAYLEEGNAILNESKKLVPFEFGYLTSTGQVSVVRIGDGYEVNIFYDSEYAAAVHEINKNYNHGRTWQYLRRPVMAARKGFIARIRDRAKKIAG